MELAHEQAGAVTCLISWSAPVRDACPTRAFRCHLKPLLKVGLLEVALPDKPTHPDQRHRITGAGHAVLAGQEGNE